MACDLCGAKGKRLTDLLDIYKTDEVKQVCDGCAHDINRHLSKVRTWSSLVQCVLVNRFMAIRRGEKIDANMRELRAVADEMRAWRGHAGFPSERLAAWADRIDAALFIKPAEG